MNVLVLGSGGREHAIAWKVKQSKNCTNLYCLPGNPGTAQIATNVAAGVKDFQAIKKCVLENNIEITSSASILKILPSLPLTITPSSAISQSAVSR